VAHSESGAGFVLLPIGFEFLFDDFPHYKEKSCSFKIRLRFHLGSKTL
jgi:hypothetical protein